MRGALFVGVAHFAAQFVFVGKRWEPLPPWKGDDEGVKCVDHDYDGTRLVSLSTCEVDVCHQKGTA